nr:glycosyltransferase family 4 protein [Paenibacillus sp. 481]
MATYWHVPHFGGVWPLMLKMKKRLEERGHQVDIFGNSEDGRTFHMPFSNRTFEKKQVLQVIRSKLTQEQYPALYMEDVMLNTEVNIICMELAASYFGLNNYDLIHAQDIYSARAFQRVKPKHTPLVVSLHGSVAHEIKQHLLDLNVDLAHSPFWKFISLHERLGATSGEVTISSSNWLKGLLNSEYGVPSEQVEVYQYGYDTQAFRQKMTETTNPIHKPSGKKVILFTGRLIHIKGVSFLITALGMLRNMRDDFVCWIAGVGEAEESMRRQCKELGLEETVHFLGVRDDIPYLLDQSDIFVQPSFIDNQPLSLIEAQLAGKPSVVSDATGVPEMVEHGKTGLVYPQHDPLQFCTHLNTLLENDLLRNEMGRAAQQHGQSHWSLDSMIDSLTQTYARAQFKMAHNMGKKAAMKLVFPILTLNLGGAQRMLVEVTNGLVDRGYDVTIIMPAKAVVNYDVRARIVRGRHNDILDADDLPRGDILFSNFYSTVPMCVQASARDQCIHIRFSLCYEPTFLQNSHLTFPTYHATPYVIVLSNWQKQQISLNHGIEGHLVPIGVDPYMKNLHLRDNTSPAVHISTIIRNPEGEASWHRDQNYLLESLAYVKKLIPATEISLICPPDEFIASPTLQRLQQSNEFQICQPVNDEQLRYLYNKTDIYISSTLYDSGSLPGLEAMRCGAALVTTYSGGNIDYAKHDHNCLLSCRYQYQLANNIIRLINDCPLRNRLAAQGESDSNQWTWKRSVDVFEQAIWNIWKNAHGNHSDDLSSNNP